LPEVLPLLQDADFEYTMIDGTMSKSTVTVRAQKGDSKSGDRALSRRYNHQDHGADRRTRQPDRLPAAAWTGPRLAGHGGADRGSVPREASADRAFDANWLREALAEVRIEAVIPPKSNRHFPAEFDRDTYKWRHLIENFFGKLKEYRGIATRCCKTDTSFSAFIALASTVIRLR
jgi:transposase